MNLSAQKASLAVAGAEAPRDRAEHYSNAGPVYAFLPAHAESSAAEVAREVSRRLAGSLGLPVLLADFYSHGFPLWGTAEAPQRLDRHSWGAFVTHGEGFDTLEAREAHPREIRRLLECARGRYGVTCADLTQAKEVVALEVLRQADSIFVVTTSDAASLNLARYKAAWLRSINLDQNVALLLRRTPGGASAHEAEEQAGLPVCAVVDSPDDLQHLAAWLASASDASYTAAFGAA